MNFPKQRNVKQELDLLNKWYSKIINQYNVTEAFLNREGAFLTPKHRRQNAMFQGVRCLRIHNTQGLDFCMNKLVNYKFATTPIQMYYSVAKYKNGIAKTGSNLNDRKQEVEKWADEHYQHMTSYDFVIDIDSPDFDHLPEAKADTHTLINHLTENKIPFELRFSGMGYHIIIPHYVFAHYNKHFNPHENIINNIYVFYESISKRLSEEFTELIDTTIYDARRIIKAPYSLALYPEGVFVCWSFKSVWEFLTNNFTAYAIDDDLKFGGFENMYKRNVSLMNTLRWCETATDDWLKKIKVIKDGD